MTEPPRSGLNPMSMAPVVASKAKMRLRGMSALVAVCRTVVKLPAAIILFPTCVMAMTAPSMT